MLLCGQSYAYGVKERKKQEKRACFVFRICFSNLFAKSNEKIVVLDVGK
jgi:hypothetical protein